jgi:hypothetical protein
VNIQDIGMSPEEFRIIDSIYRETLQDASLDSPSSPVTQLWDQSETVEESDGPVDPPLAAGSVVRRRTATHLDETARRMGVGHVQQVERARLHDEWTGPIDRTPEVYAHPYTPLPASLLSRSRKGD